MIDHQSTEPPLTKLPQRFVALARAIPTSTEPPQKMLDDHCGTHVEMGDASLGIMGILRILGIMGNVGGVIV